MCIRARIGLLARTAGNVGEALGHFEDAKVFCQKAGLRPELAWTCYDYAETLLERDGEGGLLYTSDAADEGERLELGGRRVLRKRVKKRNEESEEGKELRRDIGEIVC